MCALVLQKQLLVNEINVCFSYIHCALSATSKFNFEPLFDFIKVFKEYLKQPIQNSVKRSTFLFPHFHRKLGRLKLLQFCELTLDVPTIATGAHLDPYSARTGMFTDLSRWIY